MADKIKVSLVYTPSEEREVNLNQARYWADRGFLTEASAEAVKAKLAADGDKDAAKAVTPDATKTPAPASTAPQQDASADAAAKETK